MVNKSKNINKTNDDKKLKIYKYRNEKDKPVEEIKKDIIKINIPNYEVNSVYKAKILCDNNSSKILNKYLPFFYLSYYTTSYKREKYKNSSLVPGDQGSFDGAGQNINEYINNIKDNFDLALGFSEKQRIMDMTIKHVERPETEYIKKQLPSYKRLERTKKLHDIILNFTLKILHDFYWLDFNNYVKNPQPIEYHIKIIIPLILKLVDKFDEEIKREYPNDVVREQLEMKVN